MKSVIRKILYTCTSTITVLIGCCGIFFYPFTKQSKSCAQTMPVEFSENSNFDLILRQMRCHLAA